MEQVLGIITLGVYYLQARAEFIKNFLGFEGSSASLKELTAFPLVDSSLLELQRQGNSIRINTIQVSCQA